MKRTLALLLIFLLFLTGCQTDTADRPTQPLSPAEQTALDTLKSTGTLPSYGLQGALRVSDERVVYGTVHADDKKYVTPAGAEFLGETDAPVSRLTTPFADLQTDFLPAGYRCYKGEYEGQEAYYFSRQLLTGTYDRLVLEVRSELPPEYFDNPRSSAAKFYAREIPYDDMEESDANYIRWIYSGETVDGGMELQRALKAPDACLYMYRAASPAVEKPPEDALYLGDTVSPCEAYTTPTTVLQTDFCPAGRRVYMSQYVLPQDPTEFVEHAVFVEKETGYYDIYIIHAETAPVYFDDGRWMVLPTAEQSRRVGHFAADWFGWY